MLYDIDPAELDPMRKNPPNGTLLGAEILWAWFETDPQVVRRCLPQGLEPAAEPRATAFVANYPQTNFGIAYKEGGLLLACRRKGETGLYCLSMPVTDDAAMVGGRERQGFPKKVAEAITLERTSEGAIGSVFRKGTEILRIEAELTGSASSSQFDRIAPLNPAAAGAESREAVNFNYKFFPSADNRSFDYLPRLVRVPVSYRARPGAECGRGTVRLRSSTVDPLAEIPVGEIVDILYGRFDIEILPGKTVGRAWNLLRFLPHAFFKSDIVARLLDQRRGSTRQTGASEPTELSPDEAR